MWWRTPGRARIDPAWPAPRLSLFPPMLSDALVAVGVAFAGVGSELGNVHRPGNGAAGAAILGAMGLTLLGRRRFPGAVLAAVASGVAAMSALGLSLEGGFLAVLVASYSAAVYGVRKLAAGLVACGVAVFAGTAVAVAISGHLLFGARPPLTTLLAAAGAWLVDSPSEGDHLRGAQAALAADAAERAAERERLPAPPGPHGRAASHRARTA